MALSDLQIERYSRQIIVPRVGGRGQERILAARITIAGGMRDIEAPLAYLAGAGAGTIELCVPDRERAAAEALAAEMRSLNPDAAVIAAAGVPSVKAAIAFIAIGDDAARAIASTLVDSCGAGAFVVARLDSPGIIAMLPDESPCPRCADRALLAEFGTRAENAEFIALAAVAEVLKLIAGCAESPAPIVNEFNGYAARVRAIEPDPRCACARRKRNR